MNPMTRYPQDVGIAVMLFLGLSCTGCQVIGENRGVAQSQLVQPEQTFTTVDVVTAHVGILEDPIEYVGTTEPSRIVTVRSQVEGTLLNLAVEVGDQVTQGQRLGKIDDILLGNLVSQEQAELAALEAELAQAKIQVNDAKIQFEQLKLQAQQAQNDAARFGQLGQVGAVPVQQAETAETTFQVAQKNVLSAQEQIRLSQQAVTAILSRIATQKAVIAENQQRQSYTILTAPITGFVLEKIEAGNSINPGDEVVKIGNLQLIKVIVEVSELDLKNFYLEQPVEITLDAFPDRIMMGNVKRISPLADPDTRQLDLEIIIPNDQLEIRGGLLARVQFQSDQISQIILPQSALEISANTQNVFIVKKKDGENLGEVEAREIELGKNLNGKVEILEGIQPGEKVVIKSGKPLTDGETVKLSILSN